MKKRNPWFVAIISLITSGIYEIYWLVSTKNEMNKKGAQIPSIWLVFAPLLGLFGVAFLQIIVHFALTNAPGTSSSNPTAAVVNVLSVIVAMVSLIAILPMSIYWLYKYASGVELVTKRATSFGSCFWWGLLARIAGLGFIWAGMMQSNFNHQVTDQAPSVAE